MFDSNNIYVVWRDDSSGNAEIYHSKYTTSWSTPQNLSNTSSSSSYPNLASKVGTQGADLVWIENNSAPYEIKYKLNESTPPTSSVTAFSPSYTNTASFPVPWSGSDASGIAFYDVQYKVKNGSTVIISQTGQTGRRKPQVRWRHLGRPDCRSRCKEDTPIVSNPARRIIMQI